MPLPMISGRLPVLVVNRLLDAVAEVGILVVDAVAEVCILVVKYFPRNDYYMENGALHH